MPDDSATEELVASAHRAILGTLLAIVLILGLGMARRLPAGEYGPGLVGVVVALASGYWIFDLFRQALRER